MNEQKDVLSSSHRRVVTVALSSVNPQTFQLTNFPAVVAEKRLQDNQTNCL